MKSLSWRRKPPMMDLNSCRFEGASTSLGQRSFLLVFCKIFRASGENVGERTMMSSLRFASWLARFFVMVKLVTQRRLAWLLRFLGSKNVSVREDWT